MVNSWSSHIKPQNLIQLNKTGKTRRRQFCGHTDYLEGCLFNAKSDSRYHLLIKKLMARALELWYHNTGWLSDFSTNESCKDLIGFIEVSLVSRNHSWWRSASALTIREVNSLQSKAAAEIHAQHQWGQASPAERYRS